MRRYGFWRSPITAERLAEKASAINQFVLDEVDNVVYYSQLVPSEGGRYALFSASSSSSSSSLPTPLLPDVQFNARTRVHEYGGQCFAVRNRQLYFVNFADQNLYHVDLSSSTSTTSAPPPRQITKQGIRLAELSITRFGIVCVAEEHVNSPDAARVDNYLALVNPNTGEVTRLSGLPNADFVAYPTVLEGEGEDATMKLAWVSWQHPNMPWNQTELWQCDLLPGGECENVQLVGSGASFQQPRWTSAGQLVYLSDQSGYWTFYHTSHGPWQQQPSTTPAEFGEALWTLGMRTWDFCDDDRIVAQVKRDGVASLIVLRRDDAQEDAAVALPYCSFANVVVRKKKNQVLFLGASPTASAALIKLDLATGEHDQAIPADPAAEQEAAEYASYISQGEHITFPTTDNAHAHAFFYPPRNANEQPPPPPDASLPPPLIVFLHGGPTSSCNNALKLPIQFWTSRGFAVADVNYRGSTGYGRSFREALEPPKEDGSAPGRWGVADVADCEKCVEYLASTGRVDASKVAIRGGSAGGFTTLACLASASKVFKTGTSYYGVTDLLALATDTHKFESRYLDRLIGPLAKFRQVYVDRSPISQLDGFTAPTPLLVLQGSEDKIVPPNQAEMMVEALRLRGVPVDYVLYPGEQHGFRRRETLVDSLNRELDFYLKVFYN